MTEKRNVKGDGCSNITHQLNARQERAKAKWNAKKQDISLHFQTARHFNEKRRNCSITGRKPIKERRGGKERRKKKENERKERRKQGN